MARQATGEATRRTPKVEAPGRAGFRPEMGMRDVTLLIVGSMVGSGIFFLPGGMLDQVGSAWPVMLAWVGGALLSLTGALTFAELGSAFPAAGGQYGFLRDSLGKGVAFLFGWTGFTVVQSATIAAVAVALAGATDTVATLPGAEVPLGPLEVPKWGAGFLAVGVIWLLTLVNWLGVRRGAALNNLATVAKLAGLAFLVFAAFALGGGGVGNFADFGGSMTGTTLGAFGLALASSLFAYDGWAQATFVVREVKDPARTVPRAILLGVVAVAALYLLASFAYLHVLPVGEVSQAAREGDVPIAEEAAWQVLGAGAAIVAVAIVVSTFGTVNTYVLASPRIYHAVAQDRDFPAAFGRLSRWRTPTYGLWYQAVWASLLTLSGSYLALADLTVFGLYVFYAATLVGYFVLRRRRPEAFAAARFRMPLRPLPAVFFLLSSLAVLGFYAARDLGEWAEDGSALRFLGSTTGMGILLIASGLAPYAFAARRRRRSQA